MEVHFDSGPISRLFEIVEEFCMYFISIHNSHGACLPHDIPPGVCLNPSHASLLVDNILDQVILTAPHSINVNKSPSHDGVNSKFFISY